MKDGTLKSHAEVEKYLGVVREMLADFGERFPRLAHSFRRDFLTIRQRTESEGIRFLTEQLPLIGKMIDEVTSGKPIQPILGFAKDSGWSHPKLLSGLSRLIMDQQGALLLTAPADAVFCVRSLAFLFYKLNYPLDKKKSEECISRFVSVEEDELAKGTPRASSRDLDEARMLLRWLFREFNPKEIRPQHGPGAVATGEKEEMKWRFKRLYKSIHSAYPYYDYFVVGTNMLLDKVHWYRNLERHDYPVAKLTTVPKDSRGPRIISMEPLELQFMQQGLLKSLVPFVEAHPLTKGHVNFTDQNVNRQLALDASLTGAWATLDMKDASDRVSEDLVWWLFAECEELRTCLLALRSKATILPDGRVQKLRKFAPMGSAICFPIEALCFWSLCVAYLRMQGVSLRHALSSVYVFGDDIIIPTEHTEGVCNFLESFNLKVNRSKSCSAGSFRESCGMDAFKGVCVTPTRIKKRWSQQPSNGTVFLHYVSVMNSFRRSGFRNAAVYLSEELQRIHGLLPFVSDENSFPGILCPGASWNLCLLLNKERGFKTRWDSDLQRVELYTLTTKISRRPTTLDGWSRALRNLSSGSGLYPDEVHLSKRCQIRRRWVRCNADRSALMISS